MNSIKEFAQEQLDYMIRIRRELHQWPELSFQEFQTAQRIKRELDKIGIPYRSVTETGIIATIDGRKPGTVSVLLEQKKKAGSSPWVFPSPNGGPISPDSVLHMLHRVLKRAGLPRVRFHDLRHTFATLALQNGVDIKTVSGMLGHFSAGFTLDTYAHVTSAVQRQAAQTMGNVLSGGL